MASETAAISLSPVPAAADSEASEAAAAVSQALTQEGVAAPVAVSVTVPPAAEATTRLTYVTLQPQIFHSAVEKEPHNLAPDGSLRILHLNVAGLPPLINRSQPLERAKVLGERLCNGEFDVLCFQEVFHNGVESILCQALKTAFPWIVTPPMTRKKRLGLVVNSGVMIASRFPIKEAKFLPYTGCIGADAWANKGVLSAKIELPNGKELYVLNTHVQSDPDPSPPWWGVKDGTRRAYKAREENFKQLQLFAKELVAAEDLPVVVCGDMNEEQDRPNRYPDRPNLMDVLIDFEDVFRSLHSLEADKGYTVTDAENNLTPVRPYETDVGNKKRIDYMLVHKTAGGGRNVIDILDCLVEKLAYQDTEGKPLRTPDGKLRCLSDHYGVSMRLKL